jgi:hypothetical protein
MKVVKLYGGLGNQFFQYAFGKSLQEKTNETVKYDTSWFETGADYDHDILYLDFFDTNYEVASEREIAELYPLGGFGEKIAKRLYYTYPFVSQLLFGYFRETDGDTDGIFESEPYTFEYSPRVYRSGSSYFDGYWQAAQYVETVADELTEQFSLSVPLSEQGRITSEKISDSESISIHVRRGDYTKNDNALSPEYYDSAIEHMNSRSNRPEYYIFSDDMGWVRDNLEIEAECTYVDHNGVETAYEDLMLMASCEHNIIANSTFSWWGAWLNQNTDKIVVAPGVWLGGVATRDIDILPDTWDILD